MVQEKDERGAAMLNRKGGEGGDEALKRTAATSRSAPRESETIVSQGPLAGRRSERCIIGRRTTATAQPFSPAHHSMDDVVAYLDRQENMEVLKRIKLGGTRPFSNDGRSVGEIVVAAIDEGRAQKLRTSAPPDLIIERDSMLYAADFLPVSARTAQVGALLPLRSAATEVAIRVTGERDQPLA
jgi:hypothetical protein